MEVGLKIRGVRKYLVLGPDAFLSSTVNFYRLTISYIVSMETSQNEAIFGFLPILWEILTAFVSITCSLSSLGSAVGYAYMDIFRCAPIYFHLYCQRFTVFASPCMN
jgi:hypothetical protein